MLEDSGEVISLFKGWIIDLDVNFVCPTTLFYKDHTLFTLGKAMYHK